MAAVTTSNLLLYLMPEVVFVVVLIMMYVKGRIRTYPIFCAFLALRILRTVSLLPLAFKFTNSISLPLYRTYFYAYWYSELAVTILVFVLLYRIFSATFGPYRSLSRWTFVLYMSSVAGCLVFSIFTTPEAVRSHGVFSLVIPLYHSSLLFRTGMLIFLFFFMILFRIGISVRDYAFGIATGLGVNAVIRLLDAPILVLAQSRASLHWLSYVDVGADLIASSVWLAYLFLPRRVSSYVGDTHSAEEIARWNNELSGLLQR